MKSAFFLLLFAVTLSGCVTYQALPYETSRANTAAIKDSGIGPVAVVPFTSSHPGMTSLSCRAAGPVQAAPSFQGYIERAFIDELKLAGVYDPSSSLRLGGRLEDIQFSSGMSDGGWTLILTLSNDRNESYIVKSTHNFDGSFFGDIACNQVKDQLSPAVQALIRDLIRDPRFKTLAKQ
jgi:hypothetical protein